MEIVIVGFGGMGKAHLEYMIPHSNFNLKGIYDIDLDVCAAAAEQGIYTYQSLDEVGLDPDVDLVLIATPNDSHKAIGIKMMERGKAILCEKPVAMNSQELEQLLTCAKVNNVIFTVNQNRRFDRDFLTAKKIIESEQLGAVFHFESKVYGSRGIPGDWRGEKRHGGGMLLDWGVHLVDQILQISSCELASLYAEFTNITNDEVDDGFRVHFKFKNGSTALAEVGTCHFIEYPRWYLAGTNGTATLGEFKQAWSENGEAIEIISDQKVEVKPIKAANGFTKTMSPRDENTETKTTQIEFEPGDPIDIYDSIFEAIKSGQIETIISHQSLRETFKVLEDIMLSAEENKVIVY
ncbi:MAG: Gfo/Idh/MocA family protein [Erysipelotrichaceae bacterium]